jgi:hypothetical protein
MGKELSTNVILELSFVFCFSTQSMPCQTVMRHEWTRNCAGDEFARNWL